jgi:hypothetical protein
VRSAWRVLKVVLLYCPCLRIADIAKCLSKYAMSDSPTAVVKSACWGPVAGSFDFLTLLCRCVPCGDAANDPPCHDDPACGFRLVESGDATTCVACGGLEQPVCCNTAYCSDDESDTACDEGLSREIVKVEQYIYAQRGTGAKCIDTTFAEVRTRCGGVGDRPCLASEAHKPCRRRTTPSADGLSCIKCGSRNEAPCIGARHECAANLVILNDADGNPQLCVDSVTYAERAATVNDGVVSQSGGGLPPCGLAGQPLCTNGGPACNGRNTIVGSLCQACGGIDEPICSGADPCDSTSELRRESNKCVACGNEGSRVCADPTFGPGCNDGLENMQGRCLKPNDGVKDQSYSGPSEATQCGMEGMAPCPGSPGCANGLYLAVQDNALMCTSSAPGALPLCMLIAGACCSASLALPS